MNGPTFVISNFIVNIWEVVIDFAQYFSDRH